VTNVTLRKVQNRTFADPRL